MFLRLFCLLPVLFFFSQAMAAQLDPQAATDNFLFEEEEEITIEDAQSHFECYDMTDDADKTVCLDQTLDLLHQTLVSLYNKKVALAAGNETFFLKKEFKQWLAARSDECRKEPVCYSNLYKRKIIELSDSAKVAQTVFKPNPEHSGFIIDFYGRKTEQGYYIDRLLVPVTREGKRGHQQIYLYELLNHKSWELFMSRPKVNQLDVNFDGNDDMILLLGNQGKEGKLSAYLIYNPEDGSFVADPLLNKLDISTFNDQYKLIQIDWQQEDDRFGTDYYGYDYKNRLQRMFRHSYVRFTDKDGVQKVRRTTYKMRRRRSVKLNTETITEEQIGDIQPDLFVRTEPGK